MKAAEVLQAEDWDRALLSAENAGLLQSWRWGEFKQESGWAPLRLAVRDEHGAGADQTCASIYGQVLVRKLPRLPVPISIAYVPRGPVYLAPGAHTRKMASAFWRAVHARARKQGAIFLKVEPGVELGDRQEQDGGPGNEPAQPTKGKEALDREMAGMGFHPAGRLQPSRTIVLDLQVGEDDLLKAMKPKTRYNIRLAGRRGVQVRRAASTGDLRAFYSLLEVTGHRDEFGVHTFPYYEQMWRVFGPDGDNSALLLLADHPDGGERAEGPIAGLLALRFGREAVYIYGASADRGREHMPNYLLQWEAITWARASGCARYDFWGIPDAPTGEEAEGEVSPD